MSNDIRIGIGSTFDDKGVNSARRSMLAFAREQERIRREDDLLNREATRQAQESTAARQRYNDALEQAGRVSLAVGASIAIGLGLATRASIEWESAFAGVRKTVDGTDAEIAVIEAEFRQLARTLPASHEELAAVGEAAGQLGVQRSQLTTFTRAAVDLGETTNLSAEEAATALAQLGNIYGITGDRADEMGENTQRAGASLVALGNNGASTERDIVQMGLRIAGAGRTIGLTQAEVLSFASALSSVGIEAEAGGSAISRVMLNIQTAVDEGGDAVEGFAEVSGVSVEEFRRQFEVDAAGAVISFIEGLGRIQESGGSTTQVLDDLGLSELRVRDALLRTSQASDLLRSAVDLGSQAWEENNALTAEAAQRYETAEARIQVARNQLNDVAIDIGGVIAPAFADAAERVAFLASGFSELPGPVQDTAVIMAAAAGAVAILGGAAAIALPAVDRLKLSLIDLGRVRAASAIGSVATALTGPWGLAVAGGVTLMALFAESQFKADQRADELRATLDQQTGAITENTIAKQAAELQNEGLLDAAERLGINSETVRRALALEADAVDALMRATETAVPESRALADAQDQLLSGTNPLVDALGSSAEASDEDVAAKIRLREAVLGLNAETEAARDKQQQLGEVVGGTSEASSEAAEAADALSGAMGETEVSAEDAAAAVEELIRTFDDMAERQINGREAAIRHKDAIASFEEQLKSAVEENGEAARTFDRSTEAGRRNEQALLDVASSANRQTEAMLANEAAHKDVVRAVDNARAEFIRLAVAAGMGADEADALARELIAVPDNTAANVNVTGTESGQARVNALTRSLSGIPNREVTVTVNERLGTTFRVRGEFGTITGRASGGYTYPGLTLVGEEGPELVDFATPGRVYTAGQTAAALASAGTAVPSQGMDYGQLARAMAEELRRQPLVAQAFMDGRAVSDVVSGHQARVVRAGTR